MNRWAGMAALLAAAALTLFSGWFDGRLEDRWGPPTTHLAAAERLEAVPTTIGPWQLESSEALSATALEQLKCTGYFVRHYRDRGTGDTVSAILIFGPAGPTAVHTPDVCLSSRNYTLLGTREVVDISRGSGADECFWATTLKSTGIHGELMRVYYAWNRGSGWLAPADARFAFAGNRYLFKLQVAGHLTREAGPEREDPCRRFLQDFVPAIQQYVAMPASR